MKIHVNEYLNEYFKNRISRKNLKDSLIIIGGFFIFSVIIALLLPPRSESDSVGQGFFANLVMIIPLAAAVFFIVLAFRLRVHPDGLYGGSSIRAKIALALIVIAIVPTIPIIVITSNILNTTISQFFTEKTMIALERSVDMANEQILSIDKGLIRQLEQLRYDLDSNFVSVANITNVSFQKRYTFSQSYLYVTTIEHKGILNNSIKSLFLYADRERVENDINTFLEIAKVTNAIMCSRLAIDDQIYSVAYTQYGQYCIVMYRLIPRDLLSTSEFINTSFSEYKKQEFLKPYFQTGIGIALIMISIGIILLAIVLSLILSQSITKPVYELVEAAEKIAKGDFNINLIRREQDEIALLYESFNQMAKQLDQGKKMMYQTQKLKAWSDIARKLIHEIKNPLTPIRLSAERLYRRYEEHHPDFSSILKEATNTIIEEVTILMNMLSEFSKFARLPEINLQAESINEIIENCIAMYHDNDKISFVLDLKPDMPPFMCDKTLLRQAFLNIIQNAIEANGHVITVSTAYDSQQRALTIAFSDDGVGIPDDEIEKVFEPTFSTKENGMGLGLAIVEKIIIDHKGTIACSSILKQGTKFTITIPQQ